MRRTRNAVFGENRNLQDHRRRIYLGVRFGCSLCGLVRKQSNIYYEHRKQQSECKNGVILTIKPQDGVYKSCQRYTDNLVSDVAQWAEVNNQGQAPPPIEGLHQ